MKETPKEYVERILAKVEAKAKGQNPLKVQDTTAKKLAQLVKGLPASKLRKRPEPDKWSIANSRVCLPALGLPEPAALLRPESRRACRRSAAQRIWFDK